MQLKSLLVPLLLASCSFVVPAATQTGKQIRSTVNGNSYCLDASHPSSRPIWSTCKNTLHQQWHQNIRFGKFIELKNFGKDVNGWSPKCLSFERKKEFQRWFDYFRLRRCDGLPDTDWVFQNSNFKKGGYCLAPPNPSDIYAKMTPATTSSSNCAKIDLV